ASERRSCNLPSLARRAWTTECELISDASAPAEPPVAHSRAAAGREPPGEPPAGPGAAPATGRRAVATGQPAARPVAVRTPGAPRAACSARGRLPDGRAAAGRVVAAPGAAADEAAVAAEPAVAVGRAAAVGRAVAAGVASAVPV